jgi:hypothetical protein
MSNNKEPIHIRIYRILSYLLPIGVFLLIAWPSPTIKDSLIGRLIFASIIAFLIWLRLKKAADEAAKAWDSLPSLYNRTQRSYSCPRCGTPRPSHRTPTSIRQLMYGDWTCANCGCEVDNTGREAPLSK